MPAEACHLRAVLAVSLLLLAGRAHAQQYHADAGLQAWRQAQAAAPAGGSRTSRTPARAGSYHRVSQPTETDEAVESVPQSTQKGELVPVPEGGFSEEGGAEYDGFVGSHDNMFDENGESCESCGECDGCDACGECGDGCEDDPAPWYALGDVTFLSRGRGRNVVFSRVRQTVIAGGVPIGFDRPVLSTTQVKFDFEPGTRVTVGRNLFRDILDRRHSVEFTFLGLFDWGMQTGIHGRRISSGGVTFGSLLSDVNAGGIGFGGQMLGGFNGADEHHIRSMSDLNNYELNYRIRRLPGRDRIVAGLGNSWTRQCTPGIQGSLLTGIRYLSINEQMSFSSKGTIADLQGDPIADFSAAYRVVTHNDLVGWQIGGDMIAQDCQWSVGMSCKAGIYGNASNQTSFIQSNNNTFAPSVNTFLKASDVGVAFVGDLGLLATWRLTPRVTLRSTYDFLWVQNLALGPQQIQHNLNNPASVNNGGFTVFQGVSLGGEYRW